VCHVLCYVLGMTTLSLVGWLVRSFVHLFDLFKPRTAFWLECVHLESWRSDTKSTVLPFAFSTWVGKEMNVKRCVPHCV
jgi:hypothetical protein